MTVDGDLADWPADTQWAPINAQASGAVLLTKDRLYAAFKTGNPDALANAGTDPTNLFKYGGALDLMLSTDPNADKDRTEPAAGDLRLLVTFPGPRRSSASCSPPRSAKSLLMP